jgi:hypothetical protein
MSAQVEPVKCGIESLKPIQTVHRHKMTVRRLILTKTVMLPTIVPESFPK